jgi:hypothetical protein
LHCSAAAAATPTVLQGPNGLQQATWGDALAAIAGAAKGLGPNEFKAIAGKLADAESMIALKVGGSSNGTSPRHACCISGLAVAVVAMLLQVV